MIPWPGRAITGRCSRPWGSSCCPRSSSAPRFRPTAEPAGDPPGGHPATVFRVVLRSAPQPLWRTAMTRIARLLSLLVVPVIATGIASTAHGHARLKTPTPRDSGSSYKDPPQMNVGTGQPCGNNTRTASQPSMTLTPGADWTVAFEETVSHPGCFVVDFSASGDTNFQVLGVKSHMNPPAPTSPTMSNPRPWSVGIKVPTAPCTACTIRLRQLMLSADVPDSGCPPATIPAAATYYSCANVVIGGTGGTTGTGGAGGTTGTGGTGGRGGTTGAGG